MDKLLGFAPDAEPTAPGVLRECVNLLPAENGMQSAPSPVNPADVPPIADVCRGAAVITQLDDERRMFAGTDANLYELVAGVWNTVGSGYTGGPDVRWQFAQFGETTLAANQVDPIQRSTGGAFTAIIGAPKARVIFSVGAFVMAMNTNDTGFGLNPDRWWCSAVFDDSDWTPSTATQCATGRLVSTPGRITAGGRMGDYAVAYKERAIYIGQYVGAPAVWDWQQIPGGDAGCVGQEAWCDVGGAHFVVGYENFWIFDGVRATPVGGGQVRQWFFDNSDPEYRYRTRCVFDRQNNRVWVFFAGNGYQHPNQALVYHMLSKQWGLVDWQAEAVLNYFAATPYTMDTLSTLSPTYAGLPDVSFDSQFWWAGGQVVAGFNASHQLQAFVGASGSSGFTTWFMGDDDLYSLLTKIRIRFLPGRRPDTAVAQTANGPSMTEMSLGSSSSINDGKFDVLDSGRWHQVTINFTGTHQTTALGVTLVQEGDR